MVVAARFSLPVLDRTGSGAESCSWELVGRSAALRLGVRAPRARRMLRGSRHGRVGRPRDGEIGVAWVARVRVRVNDALAVRRHRPSACVCELAFWTAALSDGHSSTDGQRRWWTVGVAGGHRFLTRSRRRAQFGTNRVLQRDCASTPGGPPLPGTPVDAPLRVESGWRFAEGVSDRFRGRQLYSGASSRSGLDRRVPVHVVRRPGVYLCNDRRPLAQMLARSSRARARRGRPMRGAPIRSR